MKVATPPPFYTTLAPFRESLSHGRLVLMYHQLKRPRTNSRLRGLCVAPGLFERQLSELRAAAVAGADISSATKPATDPQVTLTFDDGFTNVLRHGLPALRESGFTAINYLVADRLGKTNDWDAAHQEPPEALMDEAQVRDWLAAGMSIGAHTLTHPRLGQISPAQARAEIFDSKKKLEDKFSLAIEHFCYPYGDFNATVRALVIEAGYRTACSTAPGLATPASDPFSLPRFLATHRRPGAAAWLPFVPAAWL